MGTKRITIKDIDVYLDGDGPQTLVMLHGWPDSHHLWDTDRRRAQAQFLLCPVLHARLRSFQAGATDFAGRDDRLAAHHRRSAKPRACR